jgi:hypothetical protein
MVHFRNYSFGNVLLVARQKPQATYVAGMWSWDQLGRSVKRGEKGSLQRREVDRVGLLDAIRDKYWILDEIFGSCVHPPNPAQLVQLQRSIGGRWQSVYKRHRSQREVARRIEASAFVEESFPITTRTNGPSFAPLHAGPCLIKPPQRQWGVDHLAGP